MLADLGLPARLANALIDVTPVFGDVCPVGRLQFQDGRHRDPLTDAEFTMSATASGDVDGDGLVDEAGIC